MKIESGYWLQVIAFAFLGTVILFGLSYWMEISLTQQWVADSTDLIKSDRQLKAIGLSCVIFVLVCPISSLFIAKKYLYVNPFWYVAQFLFVSILTNSLVWHVLSSVQLISNKDPFYLYLPISGKADPGFVQVESFLLALALTFPIFWLRRRRAST